MGKLKEHLSKKIPDWRYNYRQLLDEKGDQVTSTVTINTAYSGMKGVKGMICDTSSVTADAGLHVRGKHILDLVDLKPEEILYLLLIGELPKEEELLDLQHELKERSVVPDYVWKVLSGMPKDSHQWRCLTQQFYQCKKKANLLKPMT